MFAEVADVSKLLRFTIEDAADYFFHADRTENEEYLLNIILQLGREYNKLIDDYNCLVSENESLKRRLLSKPTQ